MQALSLAQELGKLCEVPAAEDEDKPHLAFEMRKSDQAKGVSFYDLVVPMGNLSFHRADFLLCLSKQLDEKTTTSHFSKRLVSYSYSTPTSPITLLFKDGSTATCDVLIGADGIHSATRHTLLELAARDAEANGSAEGAAAAAVLREVMDPVWSGSVAYRAVVPREKLEKINPNHRAMFTPQNYMGKNKHIIVFPISRGRLINVVAFCSWPEKDGTIFEGKIVEECDKEELLKQYTGWEEEVQQLLQCIEKPSRWAINALKELPISTHGRVALVGDAAHAMTPHQGSGAGQAIEDAYILSALLAHPLTTSSNIRTALEVYESVCLPLGIDVHRRSRLNGKLYEFADPRFAKFDFDCGASEDAQRSESVAEKLKEVGLALVENRAWTWKTEVENDRERAISLLEKLAHEERTGARAT
ncbi:hypothetical protein M0805_000203 [Coniferiporia weirii]|nr:hypothetical protein M0805_000203 [Coniferiporia weirii]